MRAELGVSARKIRYGVAVRTAQAGTEARLAGTNSTRFLFAASTPSSDLTGGTGSCSDARPRRSPGRKVNLPCGLTLAPAPTHGRRWARVTLTRLRLAAVPQVMSWAGWSGSDGGNVPLEMPWPVITPRYSGGGSDST